MSEWKIGVKAKMVNGSLAEQLQIRNWTQADLARKLGISPTTVGSWMKMKTAPNDPDIIKHLEQLFRIPVEDLFPSKALRNIINDNGWNRMQVKTSAKMTKLIGTYEVGEQLRLEAVTDPAEVSAKKHALQVLNECIETLNDREKKIIRMRFGLDDGRAKGLEEVGYEFGVTRNRIRQIEQKALLKLRRHPEIRQLYEFLDDLN